VECGSDEFFSYELQINEFAEPNGWPVKDVTFGYNDLAENRRVMRLASTYIYQVPVWILHHYQFHVQSKSITKGMVPFPLYGLI